MGSSVILPPAGQPQTGPDSAFKSAATPNIVTFGLDRIGPPSPLYIQRDDVLVISVSSAIANENVTINWRMLNAPFPRGGQPDHPGAPDPSQTAQSSNVIETSQQIVGPSVIGQSIIQSIPLTEGYLLSITAIGNISTSRGQTHVRAWIVRGRFGPAVTTSQVASVLFADSPTLNNAVGWPGGRQQNQAEGIGWSHSRQVANPAAGVDWALALSGVQRFQVKSFSAILTTSAAVANRNIELIVDDGTNIVWRTSAPASVTATTTQTVSATTTNMPTGVVTTDFTLLIPPNLFLQPSWRIRTLTANIQAADQWSAIWFAVEEWMDGF